MEDQQTAPTALSIPQVYMGPLGKENLKGFNSVVIELDAKLDATLDWSVEKKIAEQYIGMGMQIVWSLNFGLFKELHLPLSDTSQYRSLNIALDHFFDTLLKDFADKTVGVIIFKGSMDLSYGWPFEPDQVLNFRGWLSEQFEDHTSFFNKTGLKTSSLYSIDPEPLYDNEYGKNILRFYCMRAALDYFSMLTTRFEIDLLPYVLLDANKIGSKTLAFQLIDHEDFEFIQLALKNMSFYPDHALGWEDHAYANGYIGKKYKSYQKPKLDPSVGIVIPTNPIFDPKKQNQYDELIDKIESYTNVKLLSERNITLEWQGLEDLVVLDIERESIRKLEGFVAAGGRVVHMGKAIGLENEISWQDYLKSLEER